MEEFLNIAEITFSNPVIIDIFSHYTSNSVLASFVGTDGKIRMRYRVNSPFEPPKSCEQALSLIYALFESNPDSTIGRVYIENQRDILRETLYSLAQVLDGFSDIKIIVQTPDPNTGTVTYTTCTITRTKSKE